MPHDARPRFLNLLRIRQPIGAVTSILHRLTGVLLFLLLPLAAWLLELSLRDPAGYARAAAWLDGAVGQLALLLLAWVVFHHLFAGIRFLLLDLDLGMGRTPARRMAWVATLAAPLAALLFVGGLL
ncbi:MAG TPA: succinate dehydrogenase, cytochrome b556 subunit [Thiohalobacter sp.]|nr:succinate dehydrogenase, cytochrome b556 subunit [Thiohalobacter sp.]